MYFSSQRSEAHIARSANVKITNFAQRILPLTPDIKWFLYVLCDLFFNFPAESTRGEKNKFPFFWPLPLRQVELIHYLPER